MAMSRGRIPRRGSRGERGLRIIITILAYCACLSVRGSLVTVSVREREVSRTVGQSALLSGPYCTLGSELKVEWSLYPSKTPFVKLTRPQCAPHPDGSGCNSTDRPPFITASHIERIDFYPDNGSLLLRNLRSSDSGVYVISVYCGGNNSVKDNVTLTVHNGTGKATSTTPTTTQSASPTIHRNLFIALPIFLVVIVTVAVAMYFSLKTTRGSGCKSDTTEKIAQSNTASWEELDENKDHSSQVDITYTLLQLPSPDRPTATQGEENCIIYSAPQKNKDQNSHGDLTYSLLQLPLRDSPRTVQGPETRDIYSAPRKVR